MGLDAETGVFMLLFLDLSYDEAKAKGLLRNKAELIEAIIHGAVKRVRPKAMTVFAAMFGLMPIMWSVGAGADVMKRIAAPMVGGLVTSFALELLVYPADLHALEAAKPPEAGPGCSRPCPGTVPDSGMTSTALRAQTDKEKPHDDSHPPPPLDHRRRRGPRDPRRPPPPRRRRPPPGRWSSRT